MDLNQKEIQELQEKLILIYKFIKQEKMFEKFFLEGIDVKKSSLRKNELINKLLEMDDAEEFLESCIMELEELKNKERRENELSFNDIIGELDFEDLHHKYGMASPDDVDKLDIKDLMRFL